MLIPPLVMTTVPRLARWVVQQFGNAIEPLPAGEDATSALEAAMAAGGLITIRAGTYLLNQCDIPVNVGDITLQPEGEVILQWHGTTDPAGSYCLGFQPAASLLSTLTLAAGATVADETNWPDSNRQALTRITDATADFTAFSAGDVCYLDSNDSSYDGYPKGEMFTVAYVGGTYLIASRELHHAYTPATHTTRLSRLTATPKLTIRPGITFVPADDTAAITTVQTWNPALRLFGAVRAEIDVAVVGSYNLGIYNVGSYETDIRLHAQDQRLSIPLEMWAYGYGEYGPSYGCRIDVTAHHTGDAVALGPTTSFAAPGYVGVPQRTVIDAVVHQAKARGVDSHWSIKPHFGRVEVYDSCVESTVGSLTGVACRVGAIDPTFDVIVCAGVHSVLLIHDCHNLATHYRIGHLDADTHGTPVGYGIATIDDQSGGLTVRPTIEIFGGNFRSPGGSVVNTSAAGTDIGYTLILHNMHFDGVQQICQYVGAREIHVDIHNCRVSGMVGRLIRTSIAIPSWVRIFGLDIVKSGAFPEAVGAVIAAVAVTVPYRHITFDSGTMNWLYSGSTGGSSVTGVLMDGEADIT